MENSENQAAPPEMPENTEGGQETPPEMPGNTEGGQAAPPEMPGNTEGGQAAPPEMPGNTEGGQETPPEMPGNTEGGQAAPPEMPGNTESGQETPPEKPGFTGGKNINPPTYSGVRTISSDENIDDLKVESEVAGKNAILVNGGSSVINKIELVKKGNSNTEDADFYGTNAGILVHNNGKLYMEGGTITTDGAYTNAVFSYDTGEIDISNAEIKTMKNNSGGVMVSGGGKLTANNLKITTEGDSSAAIRSDRGGGILTVNKGEYISNGVGSPAIYSTASEGAIVEGANSITLNKTTLVDNNNKLNDQSETYKNIFLYRPVSGDASEGIASFSADESLIETNKGDTIFVTNTKAKINLSANKIVNNDNDGAFLKIQKGKWGQEGKNGGVVLLDTENQELSGDIYVDDISELTMNLKNKSKYSGTINGQNSARKIDLSLDETSVLTLTGDSYLSSLTDDFKQYNKYQFEWTHFICGRKGDHIDRIY